MRILPSRLRPAPWPALDVRVDTPSADPVRVRIRGLGDVVSVNPRAGALQRTDGGVLEVTTPVELRVMAGRSFRLTFQADDPTASLEVTATGGPLQEYAAQGRGVTLWRSLLSTGISTRGAGPIGREATA